MENHLMRDDKNQRRRGSSRRVFFKSMGEVISGATLAVVGLGALNSKKAFAAGIVPNFIPCPGPGYQETVCLGRNTSDCGNLYKIQVWEYEGGGTPNPGVCCPYSVRTTFCSNRCDDPVTCH